MGYEEVGRSVGLDRSSVHREDQLRVSGLTVVYSRSTAPQQVSRPGQDEVGYRSVGISTHHADHSYALLSASILLRALASSDSMESATEDSGSAPLPAASTAPPSPATMSLAAASLARRSVSRRS